MNTTENNDELVDADGKEGKGSDDVSESSEESIVPPEFFEQCPSEVRQVIQSSIGMFSGTTTSPLAKKITSEHITTLIKNDAEETKNQFKMVSSNRYFTLLYVSMILVTFIFITYFFAESNPSLYKDILSHIFVLIAGFGAGWGYCKSKN